MSGVSREGKRIAAIFDLDGTLLPEPSLERRLFRELRRSRVLCKRFESATEQNNFVFLPRMPEDASDAFVEKREGVEVTQGARSAHLRQVTFVGALYGE